MFLMQTTLNGRALYEWARQANLSFDEGYVTHAALRAAFGDAGPQPFTLRQWGHAASLTVLGYGTADADELRQLLAVHAEPMLARAFGDIATKAMPAIPTDQRLGFEARVCPIVRRRDERDRTFEQDAALASRLRGNQTDRQAVYVEWLRNRLAPAAELEAAALTAFRLTRHVRRSARGVRIIPGHYPDATMRGTLIVRDAPAFATLLCKGVGRHTAFGYGMLLLRPARAQTQAA